MAAWRESTATVTTASASMDMDRIVRGIRDAMGTGNRSRLHQNRTIYTFTYILLDSGRIYL
jgi:hypothetical protein